MKVPLADIDVSFVEDYATKHKEMDWLKESRIKAWKSFKTLPDYQVKYGTSIVMHHGNVKLSELMFNTGAHQQSEVIFDKSITIANLHTADASVKDYFGTLVEAKTNLLAAHYALCEGFVIIVPKGVKLEKPLKLNMFLEEETQFNHIIVVVGEGAEIDIVDDSYDYGRKGFRTHVVEVFVGDTAKVNYVTAQRFNPDVHNFTIKRGRIGKDATLNWLTCAVGSKFSHMESTSLLEKEGGVSTNHGIFLGVGDQQFDLLNSSLHLAPYTVSDIKTKGVVKDTSKVLCRGSIEIRQEAYGSDAQQRADILTLNKGTEADAIPELKIDNNNVKCSHGSTIGQVDADQLFYLMSRSLSLKDARKLIVEGFLEPTVKEMKHVDHVREDLYKRLGK